MKRAILVAVLLLGACAAPPASQPDSRAPIILSPPPAPSAPPPSAASAPPAREIPPPRPINHDQCGADQLQWLIGRSRVEIPVPLEPGRRRVLCTTCPITRDYSVFRQTILYDATTGKVTSVACG